MQSEGFRPSPPESPEKPKQPISLENISKAEIEYLKKYITAQFVRYGSPSSDPEIQDLTQKTLLEAVKNFNHFKGDSALKTWLVGIARHLIAQRFRELKSQKNKFWSLKEYFDDSSAEDGPVRGQGKEFVAEQIREISKDNDPFLRKIIKQAASELDPIHQQTLVYILNESKPEEMAEQEKINPSTARTRYFYTLKKIREKLERLGVSFNGQPINLASSTEAAKYTESIKDFKARLLSIVQTNDAKYMAKITDAIKTLHPTQQQALEYFIAGKKARQLADEQNISIDTANTRMFSAIRNLRAKLQKNGVQLTT